MSKGIIFTKASGLNDSAFGKSQEPIRAIINDQVEAWQVKSQLENIFCMEDTKNFAEKFVSETSIGGFKPVGENGAYPDTSFQEGFSKIIEPEEWKNRFSVTKTMLEDNKISKVKSMSNEFTDSYCRTREQFGAALLAGGIGSKITFEGKEFDVTCADKTPLFNAKHPSKTKGSKLVQSNMFKGAFSVKVMDKVQEYMQDFRDEDGNLLAVMPDTIIIPNDSELKRAVFAAIGSEKDAETNKNAINFQVGLWNVLIWPFLPKTLNGKPYFIMMDSQYNKNHLCAPWLERVKLSVHSYVDENTDANIFKGRARFGAGFNNWRFISICGEGFTEGTDLTALNA